MLVIQQSDSCGSLESRRGSPFTQMTGDRCRQPPPWSSGSSMIHAWCIGLLYMYWRMYEAFSLVHPMLYAQSHHTVQVSSLNTAPRAKDQPVNDKRIDSPTVGRA